MADLRVNFCGVELKNPITTASGTFGFGHEYGEFFDLSQLGGIGVKGLTPTERLGNPAPRIAETPQGILNCVGLQNPGIDRFIEEQIPFLRRYDTKIIANVSGNTVEEYEGMVEKISDADVDLIEMNISCPNVKCGGMAFGTPAEDGRGGCFGSQGQGEEAADRQTVSECHRYCGDCTRGGVRRCGRAFAHQYTARYAH